ncbi:hypothetical protein DH2020_040390 [Rehmannia glutinosa]|uniref:Dof-type domain-containing protein n=1 Tax=Rehmannia glutinosa TaxID=99300 RepID=A0ABR0UUB6_REHGL
MTCRRYWTKGGALRNVPIGGGCRKNKKLKSSHDGSNDAVGSSSSSSDVVGGLKFFQGLSPAMDFQLNFNNPNCFSLDYPLLGFKNIGTPQLGFHQEMGSMNIANSNNLASSIESLSCINQDRHWKLQQQRLSMMFVNGENNNQKLENSTIPSSEITIEPIIQKPQHILFQGLDNSNTEKDCVIGSSRKDGSDISTEWFFDNCYATNNVNNDDDNNNSNWSSGFQAWADFTQYTSLP